MARSDKGAATREHVYGVALALLRKRGYERTTMRAIADAAGLSLGAAYHYFRSKDAIVLAYYEQAQRAQEARVREVLAAAGPDFAERLDTVLQAMLDIWIADRKLLGVLFGAVSEPRHPLSPFSPKTARIRDRNIALFEELLAAEPPGDRRFLARQLWLMHFGVLLALLHDRSARHVETRRLAKDLAVCIARAWPLMRSPAVHGVLSRVDRLFAF